MVTRHEDNSEETLRVISQKMKYLTDVIRQDISQFEVLWHFFFTGNFQTVPRSKRPRKLSNVDTRRVLRK